MASTSDCAYARQLVQAYFTMLTVGCQREDCTNSYCYSNFQRGTLTATEAAIKSIYFAVYAPEELHPETSEIETPTILQTETFSVQSFPTDTSSSCKSTPRKRLSVAKQLDNGLNKSRQPLVKRPTMVTRVVVQPMQKPTIETTKMSSSLMDAKRRISRPKEKLFDAIRRSFSWSKKAPLGMK
eukprot:jgi/Phyca11/107237/e_gw1.13.785.1